MDRSSPTASGSPALRATLMVLWSVVVFFSITTTGAYMMRVLTDRVAPGTSFGVSLASAFVLCLMIPAVIDWRMTRMARRLDAGARGMFAKTSLAWNLLLLVLFVGAAPRPTRAALVQRGDWLARGLVPFAAEPTRTAAVWVGQHLPRSDGEELGEPAGSTAVQLGPAPESSGAARAPSAAAGELQPQQIFERFADSVVVIHLQKTLREDDPLNAVAGAVGIKSVYGLGSGFVVDEAGIVVTNHHVAEGATSLEVSLRDGRTFSPVEILVLDQQNDLALLHIQASHLPTVTVREDDAVAPGERAIAVGAPLGLEYSITDGIVSAVRTMQGTTFLQMQTTIAPGSSGGPLFDSRGRVMGVNTATREAGLNLAVSAKHVRELLKKPRAPKPLAAFLHGPELRGVRVEGADTSAIDRMALQEALEQVVLVLEGCALGPVPDNARATFTFESPGLTPELIQAWTRSPEMETNLEEKSAQCLSRNARYGGPLLYTWLLGNYQAALSAGKTVALVLDVAGFGADEHDSRGKPIELRFRVAGREGAEAKKP